MKIQIEDFFSLKEASTSGLVTKNHFYDQIVQNLHFIPFVTSWHLTTKLTILAEGKHMLFIKACVLLFIDLGLTSSFTRLKDSVQESPSMWVKSSDHTHSSNFLVRGPLMGNSESMKLLICLTPNWTDAAIAKRDQKPKTELTHNPTLI